MTKSAAMKSANAAAVAAAALLAVGRKVEDVIGLLKGIQCRNGTSCPDQLARALEAEIADKGIIV